MSRGIWRWTCVVVSVLAVAWTAGLLWKAGPDIMRTLPRLHVGWLIVALSGMVLSAYLAFEAFLQLFREGAHRSIGRLQLGHLYFTGQLMKHLPGRVWGIAYQSTSSKAASVAAWLSVNAVFMVLTTGFAVWVAVTTIGFMQAPLFGLAGFCIGLLAYAIGWHRRVLAFGCALLMKIRWRTFQQLGEALGAYALSSTALKLRVFVFFFLSWLVYLGAWAIWGVSWPGVGPSDGVVLCALYTVAWLVGYLSVVSPSGLGVRELAFAALAHRFSPDVIAGVAIIGRASLLLIDIAMGLIFLPFGKTDAQAK
jgi:hypothetical protein